MRPITAEDATAIATSISEVATAPARAWRVATCLAGTNRKSASTMPTVSATWSAVITTESQVPPRAIPTVAPSSTIAFSASDASVLMSTSSTTSSAVDITSSGVHELAVDRRPPAPHVERDLEAETDRGHHARRRPGEREQTHESDQARGRGDRDDRVLHLLPRCLVERQELDDPVDHARLQLGVAEDEAEDRDQDDRERRERDEHAVRDRRGVLAEPPGEVRVERQGNGPDDLVHAAAQPLDRPPSGGVTHAAVGSAAGSGRRSARRHGGRPHGRAHA